MYMIKMDSEIVIPQKLYFITFMSMTSTIEEKSLSIMKLTIEVSPIKFLDKQVYILTMVSTTLKFIGKQ